MIEEIRALFVDHNAEELLSTPLWEALADLLVAAEVEREQQRASIRNQCADNRCHDDFKLSEAEMLESCRRYIGQLTGAPTGGRTIAQLEARVVELEDELEQARSEAKITAPIHKRVAALERAVKLLQSMDQARGLSGMRIGSR